MAEKIVRKKAVKKTTARKAPSRVPQKTKHSNIGFFIMLGVFLLALGVSAVVGLSDKGAINVADIISDKTKNASPEEKAKFKTIPVQNKSSKPNGGLVPSNAEDAFKAPEPELENASSTASSSDAIATSTSEVVSENSDEPAEEDLDETPQEAETQNSPETTTE